jgi:hypothetical protein
MGKDIFGESKVVSLTVSKRKPRVVIKGYERESIELTSIRGSVSPTFQLMYSMGATAFITAFGNRLGNFTLAGIHIPSDCGSRLSILASPSGLGSKIPDFVTFYKNSKITNKKPIVINFDGMTITGWATSMTIEKYKNQNIDGHNFTIEVLGRIEELED